MEQSEHGQVQRVCPLCRRDNAGSRKLRPDLEWGLTACARCGFVYLETVPAYENLADDLGWQQQWRDEKKKRRQEEPTLHRGQEILRSLTRLAKRDKTTRLIRQYIGRGRLLDIGCGTGHRAKRWPGEIVPYGIDIEVAAVAVANDEFESRGGRAVCAPAIDGLAQFEDGYFDGVIMRAYLEHESAPLEVLRSTRPKLVEDGALIVKVPNYGCLNRRVRGYRSPGSI